MLRVFVYGTLKPGYANYQAYCSDRILNAETAMVRGQLFDLPLGYPAMVAGPQWVKGDLLSFPDDQVLSALDQLEDYQPNRPSHRNEYQREWVEVFTPQAQSMGYAWTYVMDLSRVTALQGRPIMNGEWHPASGASAGR